VPWIFSFIQQRGDIADDEMTRTFNLGIGLTAVVRPGLVPVALAAVPDAVRVGTVVPLDGDGPRVAFL
jgi:phosphoribosylformylglycinamidine cyclo-ligase